MLGAFQRRPARKVSRYNSPHLYICIYVNKETGVRDSIITYNHMAPFEFLWLVGLVDEDSWSKRYHFLVGGAVAVQTGLNGDQFLRL